MLGVQYSCTAGLSATFGIEDVQFIVVYVHAHGGLHQAFTSTLKSRTQVRTAEKIGQVRPCLLSPSQPALQSCKTCMVRACMHASVFDLIYV